MLCLSGKKANTNEEFRQVVKAKIRSLIVLFFLGVLSFVASIVGSRIGMIDNDSYLQGLFAGIGAGLVVTSIFLIIKYKKVLKDEEKLKALRLEQNDERNIYISNMAIKSAASTIIVLLYVVMIVGSFINMYISIIASVVIALSIIIYLGFNIYYNKKM